jgi:hypothetical protein
MVETRRGSTFVLCRRSEGDPRFARYPALPMLACAGFEPDGPAEGGRSAPAEGYAASGSAAGAAGATVSSSRET